MGERKPEGLGTPLAVLTYMRLERRKDEDTPKKGVAQGT